MADRADRVQNYHGVTPVNYGKYNQNLSLPGECLLAYMHIAHLRRLTKVIRTWPSPQKIF